MRGVLLSLALVFVVTAAAPTKTLAAPTNLPSFNVASTSTADSLQAPDKTINIDVNVAQQGRAWYRSPVWIAIGVLATVVILLIIVLIARGGGSETTIVKD